MIGSVLLFFLFGCLILLALFSRRHLVFGLLLTSGIPYTLFMPKATFLGVNPQAAYLFMMMAVTLIALLFHVQELLELSVRFWAITLFLFYTMLSLLWAADTVMGLRMLLKLAAPFLFFVAIQLILKTDADLKSASGAAFLCCFIVLVLAVMNHLTRGAIFLQELETVSSNHAFTAPYMTAANFSFLQGSGAVLALGYWFATRKLHFLAIYLVFTVAVFLGLTRISMAGLVVATGIVIFCMARSVVLKILIPVLIVTAFVTAFFTVESFQNRMFKTSHVSLEKLLKTDSKHLDDIVYTSGRSKMWKLAADRFLGKNILLGSGAGAVDSWLEHKVRLHSEYLRLICDLGIVGLALYLAAIGQIVIGMVMSFFRADVLQHRQFAATGLGALAFYAVTLATDNSLNYVTEFGLYVFAMAGATFVTLSPEPQPDEVRQVQRMLPIELATMAEQTSSRPLHPTGN